MSFTATVENGAIKLPPDVVLPNGTEVRIEPVEVESEKPRPFSERYAKFIGVVKDGPTDLADNLDHYLYGLPRRKP